MFTHYVSQDIVKSQHKQITMHYCQIYLLQLLKKLDTIMYILFVFNIP